MHRFEIKLKQHTPIIHFQYNQNSALLRGTEIKPKLDRFLIEKCKAVLKPHHFIINRDGKQALDYKLSCSHKGTSTTRIAINDKNFPMFFGNIGSDYVGNEKGYSFTSDPVQLSFFTFHEELKSVLTKNIEAFFATTNFGSRQSKGYGSFTVLGSQIERYFNKGYAFETSAVDYNQLLKRLNTFTKSMRAGYNEIRGGGRTVLYMKPLIFAFAKAHNIQWEKKTIKQKFLNPSLAAQKGSKTDSETLHFSSEEKRIIKDLFGMSSTESWRSYSKTITKENPEIKRFQSPLFIKPVQLDANNYKIYFSYQNLPKKVLQETYTIKDNKYSDNGLRMKIWDKFNFHEFIEFIGEIDWTNYIQVYDDKMNRLADEITTIFTSIEKVNADA